MVIDKESKRMLDVLISGEPDFPRYIFSYEHIAELSGLEYDVSLRIVKGLLEKGLVEQAHEAHTGIDIGIALTQAGVKYKEIKALEAKARWLERLYGFLSGVAVTVLGGLFASALLG